MQAEKQRAIAEYFGEANQILKAHEELDEIKQALEDYCNNQNNNTLKALLIESYDLINVLEGLYRLNGGCLHEIAIEKEYKLIRACDIINKIPPGTTDRMAAYNELRYPNEQT